MWEFGTATFEECPHSYICYEVFLCAFVYLIMLLLHRELSCVYRHRVGKNHLSLRFCILADPFVNTLSPQLDIFKERVFHEDVKFVYFYVYALNSHLNIIKLHLL